MKWVLFSIALCLATVAGELTGKVVAVTDGDTIKVLGADKKQIRIRLYGIDSPEKKQAYGQKAKQHLSKLVFGKTVTLKVINTDRYGRKVCKVYVGPEADSRSTKSNRRLYVNLTMVQAGYAWHYKYFAPKDDDLAKAEALAKKKKLGLWADPNPVNPYIWRKSKRVKK